MKTALNLMDALQDRLIGDIEGIEEQFLNETTDQAFQFLKGRKHQCRLVLEYIEALRKAGEVYEQTEPKR